MKIKKIYIKNFKNISNIELELNPNVNILIGDNAQGKTNILESIYVTALTKARFLNDDKLLIKKGNSFAKINIEIFKKIERQTFEIIISEKSKKMKINNIEIQKVSDYISNIDIIIFTPTDLEIIKNSPINRRKFLNVDLCQLYKKYTLSLNEYNKILKIRNDYLKLYSKFDEKYFNILTDKLIEKILIICDYRENFINQINENIGKIFYKIARIEGLHIEYFKNIDAKSIKTLKEFFKNNIENEINNKTTLYGPHRDDFSLLINNQDLKLFGSQGQQRLAILAMKLAEISIFKKIKLSFPIVLLDDVLSEIDLKKQNRLLEFIKSNIQYIITTTDLEKIDNKILQNANIYKIKKGNAKIERKQKNGK